MRWWQDWGFSWQGWQTNQRGEYWFVAQVLLLALFPLLPVYRPWPIPVPWGALISIAGGAIALCGLLIALKAFFDLGSNLTPLPHPKDQGELVQMGLYAWVRHPLYCGLLLLLAGLAIALQSMTHLALMLLLFLLLNAKASREEAWLSQRFPEYPAYQKRVSKLIPGLF